MVRFVVAVLASELVQIVLVDTLPLLVCDFFFNDTATTEIYTLSLHDALPIWWALATSKSGFTLKTSSKVYSLLKEKMQHNEMNLKICGDCTRTQRGPRNLSSKLEFVLKRQKRADFGPRSENRP